MTHVSYVPGELGQINFRSARLIGFLHYLCRKMQYEPDEH